MAWLNCFFIAPSIYGQAAGPADARVESQNFVRIERSTHPFTTQAADLGRVEADRSVNRMLLVLRASPEKELALEKLLDEQQNHSSPSFHHWLTPAEFGSEFGAASADLLSVRAWLEASGFTVRSVAQGARWIEFSGTSQQVEKAFRTEMHYFQLAGKRYVANSTDISLPQSIARISGGLVSLNNFPKHPPTELRDGVAGITAEGKKVRLTPDLTAIGNTNTYYLAPGDFAAIYNTKPLLAAGNDGTGITIAITGQSQIELTDVEEFRKIFALKANDPNIFVSGPDPGIAGPIDQQEATLDVEWSGAIAPGATIDLVLAGSTDSTNGVDLAAAYAIDNSIAPILTYTYGSCEHLLETAGNAFYNSLWQQAAAEGITVLVATGDNGSAACDSANPGMAVTDGLSVNGAATTPYNVAVGGTEFNDSASPAAYWSSNNAADYSSAFGYIPETAWNESCDPGQPTSATNCVFSSNNFSTLAGGGGASTLYAKPSWQAGSGVPADNFRDIPDVALAAASGHDDFVYCNSQGGIPCEINSQNQVVGLTLVGGTSAATPAMAGILALVEQKNGAYQGQINYTLYKLAQNTGASCTASLETNPTAQNSCLFYDVTSGSNAVPCSGGSPNCSSTQIGVNGFLTGQNAGPGYDLATGLGSVNATNLANAWNSVNYLASETQLQMTTTTFAHGTVLTVSGSVAAASGTGTPTGAVSLRTSSYGDADTIAITNGTFADAKVSDLPGGQYTLTAHYAGDGTFAPSDSNSVALSVTPENSTTTLSSIPQGNSLLYGNSVELVASVQGISGAGVATGTVTVQDGTTLIGTYPLGPDGTAHIYTGLASGFSFSVGAHSLIAAYSGDNSFNASISGATSFTIAKSSPLVILGVNTLTVSTTDPIGAHAVVSGFGTVAATGNVQFTVDGTPYGPVIPLQTGGFFGSQAQASILITGLSAGLHLIGANYDGSADPNYLSVNNSDKQHEPNDPTVTVTATAGTATTTTLTAVTLPKNLGDTGTFQVKVTTTAATLTGNVALWDAVGPRTSSLALSGGTATIQFPWPQAGTTSLYAVYSGDAINAASSSTAITFPVNRGVTQVALVAPSQIASGAQVSLLGSVTGLNSASQAAGTTLAYPTGIVEFMDSLNGAPAQVLSTQSLTVGAGYIGVYGLRTKLAPGTHTLTLHYNGDTNWQPGDSPAVMVAVGPPDFALTISPNALALTAGSPGSTTVTLTPSGGFTGTVALACSLAATSPTTNYSCGLSPASVSITNTNAGTATLNVTPPTTTTAAAHTLTTSTPMRSGFTQGAATLFLVVGSIFLLAIVSVHGAGSKRTRQWAFGSACLLLCVASFVNGCGGGGGSGGGPVPSTTTLTSSNLHIAYGTTVTFGVKVTANSTPGGTVNLVENGQVYTSGLVSAGVATFQSTTLPMGMHVITAQYLGDANTQASNSVPITQIITGSLTFEVTGTSGNTTHNANLTLQVN